MIWFWTPGTPTPSPTCWLLHVLLAGERPAGALSYTYRLELCTYRYLLRGPISLRSAVCNGRRDDHIARNGRLGYVTVHPGDNV